MNKDSVFSMIKRCFPELDGKAVNACASDIWIALKEHIKPYKDEANEAGKKLKTTEASLAKLKKEGTPTPTNELLQRFLDSPMTDDDRNRYVRAAMDMELAGGASIQDLERVAKTFGLGKGEDSEIITCDFATAFSSLAEAVDKCHNKEA